MSWASDFRGKITDVRKQLEDMIDPSIQFFGDAVGFDKAKESHANTFNRAKENAHAELDVEEADPDSTGFVTLRFNGHGGNGTYQQDIMVLRYTPEIDKTSGEPIIDSEIVSSAVHSTTDTATSDSMQQAQATPNAEAKVNDVSSLATPTEPEKEEDEEVEQEEIPDESESTPTEVKDIVPEGETEAVPVEVSSPEKSTTAKTK